MFELLLYFLIFFLGFLGPGKFAVFVWFLPTETGEALTGYSLVFSFNFRPSLAILRAELLSKTLSPGILRSLIWLKAVLTTNTVGTQREDERFA